MQLYVKCDLPLPALAEQVSMGALGNFRHELREGLNLGGGEYFRFFNERSEILLVRNDPDHAEVFVESRAEYPYYFYVRKGPAEALKELSIALTKTGYVCRLANDGRPD